MDDIREIALLADTETTGLDLATAHICQLGVVLCEAADDGPGFQLNGKQSLRSTELLMYLNPGVEIPESSTAIHGITDAKVKYAMDESTGLTWLGKVLADYLSMQETHEVFLVTYNGERYDMPLIERLAREYGIESPHVWDFKHIDLFPLVQRLDPAGRHKLGEAWEDMMERPAEGAHDAAADCHMVADLLDAIMEAQEYTSLSELYDWATTGIPFVTMPFGKHKGMAIEDVPTGYLNWLFKNTEPADMSRDLRATLLKYLGKGATDE